MLVFMFLFIFIFNVILCFFLVVLLMIYCCLGYLTFFRSLLCGLYVGFCIKGFIIIFDFILDLEIYLAFDLRLSLLLSFHFCWLISNMLHFRSRLQQCFDNRVHMRSVVLCLRRRLFCQCILLHLKVIRCFQVCLI